MKRFWWLVYNTLVVPILYFLFKIARLFNKKIRSGFDRRRVQNKFINEEIIALDSSKKMVWFHSASLGEFEQAKPIIEKLRADQNVNILVTFFSPSGYDNSKKYPHADIVAYIPFDLDKAVKGFLEIVKPDVVIFMRYDIWPNLLWRLGEKQIPTMIVDATMLKNSNRKIPIIKGFHISIYKCFSNILTVSPSDAKSFLDFKIPSAKIKSVGDTRFDRVYQKSLKAQSKKLFKDNLFNNKQIFVFGSSWEEDENVIFPAFDQLAEKNKNIIMIVAPHEPTEVHLEKIENYFAKKLNTIRFSSKNNYIDERIIIIDSIGILLTLYFYADVAYVGGSFKQGIHNVLEPAVYGIPVVFGPKIEYSFEAKELVKRGASQVIKNMEEAFTMLNDLFEDAQLRNKMGLIASNYVNENIGASNKIISEIEKYL